MSSRAEEDDAYEDDFESDEEERLGHDPLRRGESKVDDPSWRQIAVEELEIGGAHQFESSQPVGRALTTSTGP